MVHRDINSRQVGVGSGSGGIDDHGLPTSTCHAVGGFPMHHLVSDYSHIAVQNGYIVQRGRGSYLSRQEKTTLIIVNKCWDSYLYPKKSMAGAVGPPVWATVF